MTRVTNIESLADAIMAAMTGPARFLVAIAGAPGAGKSTLAEQLFGVLSQRVDPDTITVVPMDGFHLDNRVLDARGLRAVKGAPQTFDASGFVRMLERVRLDNAEVMVAEFDRERDIAIAGAIAIEPRHRLVLLEGNYLLLDYEPWNRISGLIDLSVFIDVPFGELERRLVQRWLDYGLASRDARRRAEENDLVNARLVCERSTRAEIMYYPAE